MRSAGNKEIVFVSAKRTAFGTFGGSLKGFSATDLGVIASRAVARPSPPSRTTP